MKAKHWVLSGFGCIAASILVGLALGLYWLDKVRSFHNNHGLSRTADPTEGFGVVMVGAALANLLFIGGLVVLIVGFIKFAKEPSGGAQRPSARQEPSGSKSGIRAQPKLGAAPDPAGM
jgi:hypothetical protein